MDEDYETVCSWWDKRSLSNIPQCFLPVGFIVYSGDKDLAAGWLHLCKNSTMSWCNWIVTNPDNTAFASHEALGVLFENIKGYALKEGYQLTAGFFHQKSITKFALKNGWVENHAQVSECFTVNKLTEEDE